MGDEKDPPAGAPSGSSRRAVDRARVRRWLALGTSHICPISKARMKSPPARGWFCGGPGTEPGTEQVHGQGLGLLFPAPEQRHPDSTSLLAPKEAQHPATLAGSAPPHPFFSSGSLESFQSPFSFILMDPT